MITGYLFLLALSSLLWVSLLFPRSICSSFFHPETPLGRKFISHKHIRIDHVVNMDDNSESVCLALVLTE